MRTSASNFCILFLHIAALLSPTFAAKKSYIVYLGSHSRDSQVEVSSVEYDKTREAHYHFLGSFLGSKVKAQQAISHSYTRHINGFAATLGDAEAAEISKHPDVISVFLNRANELHTTRSWDLLGLEHDGQIQTSWSKARFGEDSIIATLDTGVWPESKSFSDEGYGPIPAKWKGVCDNDQDPTFQCNRKLIGARCLTKYSDTNSTDFNSPRDIHGHGTHTLSTAGGNFVPGANYYGLGNGTAKGGSPKARVAAYKVCGPPLPLLGSCFDSDILAGFDLAINDGVDVISVSIGGPPRPFDQDSFAIGSFHAIKYGIVVVCSAGNSGPAASTLSNVAPWQITVGANTIDRQFATYVTLGNNMSFKGQGVSDKVLPNNTFFPIVMAKSVKAANASEADAELCTDGTLDPTKVNGTILVCLRGYFAKLNKSQNAAAAGAVGMVLVNNATSWNEISSDPHFLPTSHLTYNDGVAVISYISSTANATACIAPPTSELGIKPAPVMASFSSRGPNTIVPEILKPDITAPGVNVIAAYSEGVSPSGLPSDTRRVPYYLLSGTSMSCPHVAGIAGLLKTVHPDWSPAAIKSAIMTTARTRDNAAESLTDGPNAKATPFSYGAGHIRPNRAMDPGLVYDLREADYLSFLCAINQSIKLFSNTTFTCSNPISPVNLNYPSITVPNINGSITVTRTVKNVGSSPATYNARIVSPHGLSIVVQPKTLTFGAIGEEKTFNVTIAVTEPGAAKDYVFGTLTWSDGKHIVRSQIVVKASA